MNTFNIAITGASGYIGSHLSTFLKNKGHTLYEMGRKSSTDNNDRFIHFELGTTNTYQELKGIDILIHCAYDFSITNLGQNKKINRDGSIELLTQAKNQGIKKIIYLSSLSAFEEAKSNYGQIKYDIERLAKPLGITIVRPGLVFNENARGIIGAIKKLISKSKIIPILGTSEKIFFPCHIEDLSSLIDHLIHHDSIIDKPIAAASEYPVTFKELIATLAKSQNRKVIMLPLPYNFLFAGLKFAEILKIKTGLRSDSLRYMKYYNRHVDFQSTRQIGIHFRSFG